MNKIIFSILLLLFQTKLYAESLQVQDSENASSVESSAPLPKNITPTIGRQYDLKSIEAQGDQHKNSYSTGAASDRNITPDSPPAPYGTYDSDIPIVPLIIIKDE